MASRSLTVRPRASRKSRALPCQVESDEDRESSDWAGGQQQDAAQFAGAQGREDPEAGDERRRDAVEPSDRRRRRRRE
jgi:hypothetical protein